LLLIRVFSLVVNKMVDIYHLIKSFFSGVERAQESKKIYKRRTNTNQLKVIMKVEAKKTLVIYSGFLLP
jgi:hypothetical protein